jgi:hypothetical protein
LVQNCLHGATLTRSDHQSFALDKPIALSNHFMTDLIEASAGITPGTDFKRFSLLFEALTYEANPGVCYPKVF